MLLAVDIGNTTVTFGLYDGEWVETWRMAAKDEVQETLYRSMDKHLKGKVLDQIVISSVVPFFTNIIKDLLAARYKIEPFLVTADSYSKLPIKVLNPKQIGSDLVADALAARDRFQSDCVVVDFGTALTFTTVADGEIKGVNIAPGLQTAVKALAGNTAKLSEIPLELPKSVIGTDTTTAIQSGILWGYVGLVERLIERIEDELQTKLKVVATGGLSEVLDPLHARFDQVDPNLTLEGIRLIHELNS